MENENMEMNNIDDIYTDDIKDTSSFDSDSNNDIIKVIGVGGGGGNAVDYMYAQHIPNINFVVLNTDMQALKRSKVPHKLILGETVTKGRGAGNKPEIGRECAEASADRIRELFDDQTEMVFITAGMGGGTGTGAGPVVARLAKEAGLLTIGIVTIPFLFEGDKKILKAIEGAEEMKKFVDALLVINNENLVELYKDLTVFNAFEKADDTLANAARSISEIINQEMYINVDFQDVKTILKDSGTAIISTAYGEGEKRISKAIENALHSPLLEKHDIKSSKRLLFKFVCSRDAEHPIRTDEINEISQFTANLPSSIDVKWGIADDPEMGDRVKITVLASGFDVTLRKSEGEKGGIIFGAAISPEAEQPTPHKDEHEEKRKIAEFYGHEKLTKQIQEQAKIKYAVLKPNQFDDHEVIALIERTPAFNRTAQFHDELARLTEGGEVAESHQPSHESASNGKGDITISF